MSGYNKKQNIKGGRDTDKRAFNWWLIPLILIVAIVPSIMRLAIKETHYPYYPWYAGSSQYADFSLAWKGYAIGVLGGVMFVCNIYLFAKLSKGEKIEFVKRYWPVFAYIILVLASALFALNKSAAYNGEYEQGEPIYVLLGYGMIALNVPLVVKGKKDLKAIFVAFLVGVFLVTAYGVLEACKIQPLEWNFVQHLTMSASQRRTGQIQMRFEEGRVISTLFNPNYFGPYVALTFPIILTYLFVAKKVWKKLIVAVLCIFLLICLVFSGSKTGVIICSVVFFLMIIFAFKTWTGIVVRRWYFAVPVLLLIILAGKLVMDYIPEADPQRIIDALTIEEDGYDLKGIDTTGDCVKIVYNDSTFEFRFEEEDDETIVDVVEDGNTYETLILNNSNENTASFEISNGETVSATVFRYSKGYNGVAIFIGGKRLRFTNQVKSGDYQFVNYYDCVDESIIYGGIFKNYKKFASGRGYSWSQFLPVVAKYIVVGAGPDNYPFAVYSVGDDYAYKINSYQEARVFSRPHNLFIQMWVNTGLLSLLMFLIFAGWYVVDCFKTYFNKKITERFEFIGLACMAGVLGFLGNGIANDSIPCVTPLYWVVLGCGIVINGMIKKGRKA